MNKIQQKQKGFAVLESLLILIVIGVIGGIGWYAYNSKQKTDKILSQADKISQSTPVKSTSNSSTQKYLSINEWGVKLEFADAYKLTYKIGEIQTDPKYGKWQSAQLLLNNNAPGDCLDTDVTLSKGWEPSGTGVGEVHIGDYYYQIGGGAAEYCVDDPGGAKGQFSQLRWKISQELSNLKNYKITKE